MSVNPTIKKLIDTADEHKKLLEYPIEAGELANEAGKSYMKGLWKAIQDHEKFRKPTLWFIVKIEKEMGSDRIINITIGVIDKPLIYLRDSTDLWKYSYITEKLYLEWSLPHKIEMKNFLRAQEKYDSNLIKWIREYIAQEKTNLNDPSSIKIK